MSTTYNTATPAPRADDNTLALRYIERLASQGFWGNIALKFQNGSIIHITREESLKPSQTVPEYRRTNADINSR